MPQDKNEILKNMNIFFSAMKDDHLGKSDFTTQFKRLVAFVKQVRDSMDKRFNSLESKINGKSDELKTNTNNDVSSLRTEVNRLVAQKIASMNASHKTIVSDIDFKMANVRDGKDADEKRVIKKTLKGLLKEIPSIKKIIKGIKKEKIRDALESLKGEERLDIDSIDGLREALSKQGASHVNHGGIPFGGVTQHYVDDEELTGTKNGVNKAFTINHTPSPATTLKVYRAGARQQLNPSGTTDGDYSYSSKTITFNIAPVSGEILLCDYIR